MWGSRTWPTFGILGPPERLKLEIINLARRRMAVSSNEENAKLGQKVSCVGHVTQFWNCGNPLISRERLKLETSNLVKTRMAVSSNEENAKLGQKGSCGGHVTQFWDLVTVKDFRGQDAGNCVFFSFWRCARRLYCDAVWSRTTEWRQHDWQADIGWSASALDF